jgi:hypothetical protein
MRKDTQNPIGNELPSGCREEALVSAIDQSGYPLQGQVAYGLQGHFRLTEEWGYFDSSTNEHRSLDIFGYRKLIDNNTDAGVQPACVVLVECKRSTHPYVFFRLVTEPIIRGFPVVAGVKSMIPIYSPHMSTEVPASRVLGLDKEPFICSGPSLCSTFCRGIPKGKEIELSGVDPFKSIILPLARALDHTVAMNLPRSSSILYPRVILAISVLDAPIILVEAPDKTSDPLLTPWVRVVRHETTSATIDARIMSLFYVVDIIHIGFLDTFIQQYLLPFSELFAKRAIKCGNILAQGGQVQNLNEWKWDQIRAKPRR